MESFYTIEKKDFLFFLLYLIYRRRDIVVFLVGLEGRRCESV